jgi:hypothetical protein
MKNFLFGFWLGIFVGLTLIFSVLIYEPQEQEQEQEPVSGQWIGWKNKQNKKPWEIKK